MNSLKMAFAGVVLATAAPTAAQAATLIVNVAGTQSFADYGTAGNTVRTYNIGAGSTITGVTYNVNITAFSPSYLSEATLAFTESANSAGVFLAPGFADDLPGTQTYSASVDLVAAGLSFAVGTDGLLRLEYFESFNDPEVGPDAIWNSGTVTFDYTPAATAAVPEPATWGLMLLGFGAMGYVLRRRKVTMHARYA